MAKATKQAEVPSILAFNRKIEPSDAVMLSGRWEDQKNKEAWKIITLHEKRNRGTKSQYGVADDEKHQSNPVWVDDATLPNDVDTLKVEFTVKFLGNIAEPTTHNRPEFEEQVKTMVADYENEHGYQELANRYVQNLANGRFLWRNRLGSEKITVYIEDVSSHKTWCFEDAYQFKLTGFDHSDANIQEISTLVENSFKTNQYLLLKVTAYAKLGEGQHLFPSQEMVMDIPKGQKSKHLYQIQTANGLCAGMHSEKIGNAIRTIDTWYTDNAAPIAIEPYGSVPTRGEAYRKSKNDFYTLLIDWKNGKEISVEDKHFVIAVLIRGGVFGGND